MFQMTEFQRLAGEKGYTIKVVGDYAYRKRNSPQSPFVRLKNTIDNKNGTYDLEVAIINPYGTTAQKEIWTTRKR